MLKNYRWGIALVNPEHPSDRTKRLHPPKVTLMFTSTEISVWDSELSCSKMIRTTVPWTFVTRKQAREVAKLRNQAYSFSKYIKVRVVKFQTIILEES